MAKAIVILKTDYVSLDKTCPIKIRLTHKKTIDIPTGFKVKVTQWKDNLVIKHPDAAIMNAGISDKLSQANSYFANCIRDGKPIILSQVFKTAKSNTFDTYLLHRADQYKAAQKINVCNKLKRLVYELQQHYGPHVFFSDITLDSLRDFESHLAPNNPNTRKKKFKTLGQMFSAAIDDDIYVGHNPFKKYKIETYPVKKEKLSLDEIAAIEKLYLSGQINDARNLFLFSYYAKGVRFENCIFLKRSQVRDGRIYFTTNKGKKHISVLINVKIKNILDQYDGKNYIFPFVHKEPANAYEYTSVKDSANSMVNRFLKVVAGLAGIKKHLTFHLSRHAISYHLKQAGVNTGFISDILGHSSEKVTQVYLKSLGDEQLDAEMKKVYGD